VLYERILGRVTPALPRFSATLVEPAIGALLSQHGLTLEQVFAETALSLASRLAERAMPVEEKRKLVDITDKMSGRSVNEGYSGGEKKKNEIFQMALLEPSLAILDETDSGLDIDALRVVANGVNKLKAPDNAVILVTHYQRLLNYIVPDFVHVLYKGKIVKSGGKELALELEEKGYDFIKDDSGVLV